MPSSAREVADSGWSAVASVAGGNAGRGFGSFGGAVLSSAALRCRGWRDVVHCAGDPLERRRGAPQCRLTDLGSKRVAPSVLGGVDGVERGPAGRGELEQLGPLVLRVVPPGA